MVHNVLSGCGKQGVRKSDKVAEFEGSHRYLPSSPPFWFSLSPGDTQPPLQSGSRVQLN